MTDQYTADVEWADGQWQASVQELPGAHTYARTISALHKRLREVIVLMADRPDTELEHGLGFTVALNAITPPGAPEDGTERFGSPELAIQRARAARQRVAEVEAEAEHVTQTAVLRAQDAGISFRDTGALLGLSHQRVQQIAQEARAR